MYYFVEKEAPGGYELLYDSNHVAINEEGSIAIDGSDFVTKKEDTNHEFSIENSPISDDDLFM